MTQEPQPQPAAPPYQPPYAAPAPYQRVSGEQRDIWRTKGRRAVAFGALWLLGGLVLTIATYTAAPAGGAYIVAWGPVVYGVYQLVRGFVLMGKAADPPGAGS
jgi:hypothetical protein